MKHIAVGLDCDGCLIGPRYIHPFTSDVAGDIRKNTSIIDTNNELWCFIDELCKGNPDLETLTLVPFSLRQDISCDAENSYRNKTESFYLIMEKIAAHLMERLKKHAPKATVHLNKMLMEDIYNEKTLGETWKKAMELIDYSSEGLGRIDRDTHSERCFWDESKITYVFAHAHSIHADAFHYFDDSGQVHDAIRYFYDNPIGNSFLPSDVKVFSHIYYDSKLIRTHINEITATGHVYPRYTQLLLALEDATTCQPFTVKKDNHAYIIKKFQQIHSAFQNPLSAEPTTPHQASIILHSLFSNSNSTGNISFEVEELTPLQERLAEGLVGFK